jgi:hypothetical protein
MQKRQIGQNHRSKFTRNEISMTLSESLAEIKKRAESASSMTVRCDADLNNYARLVRATDLIKLLEACEIMRTAIEDMRRVENAKQMMPEIEILATQALKKAEGVFK